MSTSLERNENATAERGVTQSPKSFLHRGVILDSVREKMNSEDPEHRSALDKLGSACAFGLPLHDFITL